MWGPGTNLFLGMALRSFRSGTVLFRVVVEAQGLSTVLWERRLNDPGEKGRWFDERLDLGEVKGPGRLIRIESSGEGNFKMERGFPLVSSSRSPAA